MGDNVHTIFLKRSELKEMDIFYQSSSKSGSTIYQKDETTLYKCFGNYFDFELEQTLALQALEDKNIPHSVLPLAPIRLEEHLYGYAETFLKGSQNWREVIKNKSLSISIKQRIIADVVEAFQELHKHHLVYGDVHLGNLLIHENKGYVIDFEGIRTPYGGGLFRDYYLLHPNENIPYIKENEKTDHIKLVIAILSLLYEIPLDSYMKYHTLIDLSTAVHTLSLPTFGKDYLLSLLNQLNGDITYFNPYQTWIETQDFNKNQKILKRSFPLFS